MSIDNEKLARVLESLDHRLRGIEDLLGVRTQAQGPTPAGAEPPPTAPVAAITVDPPAPPPEAPPGSAHKLAPDEKPIEAARSPMSPEAPPPTTMEVPPPAEPMRRRVEPPPIPVWATEPDSAHPANSAQQTTLAETLMQSSRRAERERAADPNRDSSPAAVAPNSDATSAHEPVTQGPYPLEPDPPREPPATEPRTAEWALPVDERAPLFSRQLSWADAERLIGGRWYAVIGAVAVVIGIGLFFKLGYERGWFAMAPWLRCALGAAFGFALLGAGEWVRKKVNNAAAAGIYSAGLGTLYASAYAAYRLYDLLPDSAAYALLAATAILGVVVSVRTRLVFVAVLSLAAGYLTPFLFTESQPRPLVLPAYLLMLLAVGLVVCGRMGRAFAPARSLVWWGTLILGGLWELNQGVALGVAGAAFAALVWAALHAELAFSSGRWGLRRGDESDSDTTVPRIRRWTPLLASFTTSAWAVTFASLALERTLAPAWVAAAAGMVATGLLASLLSGGMRGLFTPPANDAQRLGACLWVQSAGLLVSTIAMAFAGWAEVVCWMALGLSAILAARWNKARAFDIYGLAVLVFCIGRLFTHDLWLGDLTAGAREVAGLALSSWTILTALAGASMLVAGRLILPQRDEEEGRFTESWRIVSDAATCLGLCVLAGSLVHRGMSSLTFSYLVLTASGLAFAWGWLLRSPGVAAFGSVPLVLATILACMQRFDAVWSGRGATQEPIFSAGFFLVLGCAAVWIALSAHMRRLGDRMVWGMEAKSLSGFAAGVCFTLLPIAFLHPRITTAQTSMLFAATALLTLARARIARSEAGSVYAAVLILIATLAAVGTSWWVRSVPPAISWAGLVWSEATPAPLLCGAAWLALAVVWLTWRDASGKPSDELNKAAAFAGHAAVVLFVLGLIHRDMAAGQKVLVPLAAGAAVLAGSRFAPALRLAPMGLGGILLAAVIWVRVFILRGWEATSMNWPIHPGLYLAAAQAAVWEWAARRVDIGGDKVRAACRTGAIVMAFISTSYEAARIAARLAEDPQVRSAAVTIWWGLFAFGLIGLGFWKRLAVARRFGLLLLSAATLKALLLDLSGAPAVWRIVSFIGLGLLMLTVAVFYQKVAAKAGLKEEEAIT